MNNKQEKQRLEARKIEHENFSSNHSIFKAKPTKIRFKPEKTLNRSSKRILWLVDVYDTIFLVFIYIFASVFVRIYDYCFDDKNVKFFQSFRKIRSSSKLRYKNILEWTFVTMHFVFK